MVSGKSVSPLLHLNGANQAAVSAEGRYVALGGDSGAAVVEASNGQLQFRPPQVSKVSSMDLTWDGRYLAAASENILQVFDVSNRTLKWRTTDFAHPISGVAFSMNGQQLAVGGEDPELRVFSTESGEPVRIPFQWHGDCKEMREPCKTSGIAFSTDGKYVVLAASDRTVRVIDVALARERRIVDLPAAAVYGFLSADDKFVATSSDDFMGRVYDVATLREVWHLPLRQGDFFPLGFTSSDKYVILAKGSQEFVVKRFLWHPQDLIDQACSLLDHNLTRDDWKAFSKEAPPTTCTHKD